MQSRAIANKDLTNTVASDSAEMPRSAQSFASCVLSRSLPTSTAMRPACPRTDIAVLGDRRRVNLDDVEAALLVRQRNLNLAVEAARTHQRRVERVRPIGGHDHLDHAERVETVQLIQQLWRAGG